MTLNPYFKQHQGQTNEADLYQKLVTEAIQIAGVESYYLKRDSQNADVIFNEDPRASFNENFCIEIYIENFEGFNGMDNDIITSAGLDLNDELKLVISAERFDEESDLKQPREGDLIYLPLSDTLFEIAYIDDEADFYSLGNVKSYPITARIFDYSGETFNTGLDEIDTLDDDFLTNNDFANSEATEENDEFDTADDNIVDFTEDNPFGTFGN